MTEELMNTLLDYIDYRIVYIASKVMGVPSKEAQKKCIGLEDKLLNMVKENKCTK